MNFSTPIYISSITLSLLVLSGCTTTASQMPEQTAIDTTSAPQVVSTSYDSTIIPTSTISVLDASADPSLSNEVLPESETTVYVHQPTQISFRYPTGWFIKEFEDQYLMLSPDPTFDGDNRLIGEHGPITISLNPSAGEIEQIEEEYQSTIYSIQVGMNQEFSAKAIAYTALNRTFTNTHVYVPNSQTTIGVSRDVLHNDQNNIFIDLAYQTLLFSITQL